jgi:hypothetical protein
MKVSFLFLALFMMVGALAQQEPDRTKYFPIAEARPFSVPKKKKVWVFVMAGQSNMAGRGQVLPEDTTTNERILAINRNGDLVLANGGIGLWGLFRANPFENLSFRCFHPDPAYCGRGQLHSKMDP